MTVEIALSLLAAAIPLTALALKLSNSVSPMQFQKLEMEFHSFRREVRVTLNYIKRNLEKKNGPTSENKPSSGTDTDS